MENITLQTRKFSLRDNFALLVNLLATQFLIGTSDQVHFYLALEMQWITLFAAFFALQRPGATAYVMANICWSVCFVLYLLYVLAQYGVMDIQFAIDLALSASDGHNPAIIHGMIVIYFLKMGLGPITLFAYHYMPTVSQRFYPQEVINKGALLLHYHHYLGDHLKITAFLVPTLMLVFTFVFSGGAMITANHMRRVVAASGSMTIGLAAVADFSLVGAGYLAFYLLACYYGCYLFSELGLNYYNDATTHVRLLLPLIGDYSRIGCAVFLWFAMMGLPFSSLFLVKIAALASVPYGQMAVLMYSLFTLPGLVAGLGLPAATLGGGATTHHTNSNSNNSNNSQVMER